MQKYTQIITILLLSFFIPKILVSQTTIKTGDVFYLTGMATIMTLPSDTSKLILRVPRDGWGKVGVKIIATDKIEWKRNEKFFWLKCEIEKTPPEFLNLVGKTGWVRDGWIIDYGEKFSKGYKIIYGNENTYEVETEDNFDDDENTYNTDDWINTVKSWFSGIWQKTKTFFKAYRKLFWIIFGILLLIAYILSIVNYPRLYLNFRFLKRNPSTYLREVPWFLFATWFIGTIASITIIGGGNKISNYILRNFSLQPPEGGLELFLYVLIMAYIILIIIMIIESILRVVEKWYSLLRIIVLLTLASLTIVLSLFITAFLLTTLFIYLGLKIFMLIYNHFSYSHEIHLIDDKYDLEYINFDKMSFVLWYTSKSVKFMKEIKIV